MIRSITFVIVVSVCLPVRALAQAPGVVPPPAPPAQTASIDWTPRAVVPSFAQIFGATPGDFRRLASPENALIAGVGLGLAAAVSGIDRPVSDRLAASGHAERAFAAAEVTGSFPLHVAAGFAAYGIGRSAGSSRTAILGADLVRAQIVAQATTHAVKFAVGRTRPDGTSYSFPSGHTATMFATATVLQSHLGWKVGVPAYAAAAYVGAGRIQTRRHYLSDVAVGAALGLVSGRSVTVGRGRARFAVAPLATADGAGIGFTKVR